MSNTAATPAPLAEPVVKSVTERAEWLVETAYKTHGVCTLSCDCGAWEMAIDADAVGNATDTAKARELLEHARFDHVSPRNVLATAPAIVYDTTNL